jgi:hypothetical protein
MKIKSILLLPIKTLLTLQLITLLFSPLAYAGCGEAKAVGWIADAESGQMIENLGSGTVVECGNMNGAFGGGSSQISTPATRHARGIAKKDLSPVTYVKVCEKWAPGK